MLSTWACTFSNIFMAKNIVFDVLECVSVRQMRQGIAGDGLGEAMYKAFKYRKKIPQADVQITAKDPPEVLRMKVLIVKMTAFRARDRPATHEVLAVLAQLNAQVRHYRSIPSSLHNCHNSRYS